MRSALARMLAVAIAISVGAASAQPKDAPYPKMAPVEQYLIVNRQAEIALARSAAPASISNDATVMVLTRHGYETAVEGKNGFVCLVDRSWQSPFDDPEFWNPKIRSPLCFNPPAVRSVLPLQHKITELALAGNARADIVKQVKIVVNSKDYRPETGAMSYMMSKDQHLNDRAAHWHPHLMFYLPGAIEASSLGANLPAVPVLGGPQDLPGGGRMPVSIFLVPVDKWSDGSASADHAGKP